MADETPGLSPPWVSHRTVLSQIERMEKESVPSKIDKHFLVGMAFGTQNHFRHALRSLGLIDEDSRPTQLLCDMVDKPDQRPELFGNALFSRFPEFTQLPPNASKSDFFALLDGYGVKGVDQQRKVLSFYVATADYAGVPVSPHIRPTKAHPGPRTPGTRRRRASSGTGTRHSGNSGNGAAPATGDELSPEQMRSMYFKLLLKSAAEGTEIDSDMLDRMERLVSTNDAGKTRNLGRKAAGSAPATPADSASQGEG